VIKANRIEAAEALGCHLGDPPAMMARRLAIRQGCHVVVTAGELGLWWSDGQTVRRVPAVPVQARDVCGAGDTVFAALGLEMATTAGIRAFDPSDFGLGRCYRNRGRRGVGQTARFASR
jgi:sugar/nucleoside kinase (ribokinase family)